MIFLSIFLVLSLAINCILFWYARKLVRQLSFGVNFTQQLQGLLEEYASNLEGMLEMELYYGDETMISAVKNTRMVIETCKMYEKSVLSKKDKNTEDDYTETAEE